MSGYLDVKYPFKKSSLGLNPFRSWKRQWCILRPSVTCSGGSLAIYCSEAGASVGNIELPASCIVRRAKSRSRPYAFAIFTPVEPHKPRVLLAAQNVQDAQLWMEKIGNLLNGSKILDPETLQKDSFSATVVPTELSRKCGVTGTETAVSLSRDGVAVSRGHTLATFVHWKHVRHVTLDITDKRICVISVDSGFQHGAGELKFTSPIANELMAAIQRVLKDMRSYGCVKKLSKSEGDLRDSKSNDSEIGEIQRSSWYSGPSDVSLDDIDLVMSKESRIPLGRLSRCSGAGDLAPMETLLAYREKDVVHSAASLNESMSDRRSLVSIASGIYEEILDFPEGASSQGTPSCKMSQNIPDGLFKLRRPDMVLCEEPAYECVGESVYATMRRGRRHSNHRPPPLPPRAPFGTMKPGDSWNGRINATRHASLGSLPRDPLAHDMNKTKTLLKADKTKQGFSVFRKRLKSDSRVCSPKSETSKENKDVETKKKKFDFTPTRDIFKSFKVNRKMKNLKISSRLTKGETKSCEFLDETEHIPTNRCSKSVERLEGNDGFIDEIDADLSIDYRDDAAAALSISREIVDLILNHESLGKVRLRGDECEYMPMSPAGPMISQPPIEHHYIVMSPRSNMA